MKRFITNVIVSVVVVAALMILFVGFVGVSFNMMLPIGLVFLGIFVIIDLVQAKVKNGWTRVWLHAGIIWFCIICLRIVVPTPEPVEGEVIIYPKLMEFAGYLLWPTFIVFAAGMIAETIIRSKKEEN